MQEVLFAGDTILAALLNAQPGVLNSKADIRIYHWSRKNALALATMSRWLSAKRTRLSAVSADF